METKSKIHEKLQNIQKDLNVPKSQKNTYGGYSYRSTEDILSKLKGSGDSGAGTNLLDNNGCVLVITDSIINIGERFYIEATAKLIHKGESIESKGYAREPESKKGMDDSQITGSTSSYARKYALNGLFAIDDVKDADYLNTSSEFTESNRKISPIKPRSYSSKSFKGKIDVSNNYNEINQKSNEITQKQNDKIMYLIRSQGITDIEVDLKDQFNKDRVEQLTKKEASLFIDYLDNYSARNY